MDHKAFQDYYPDELSHCYGCGRLNEHGLKVRSYWDGEETVAHFEPRPYHMAAPGYVYGGLLASLVDCHGTETAAAAVRNGWMLRNKVGGVLAVGRVRNGGQELTIQAVRTAMLCHDMICVSDGRPTAHFGAALWSGAEGGLAGDKEGLETARNLGRRVAETVMDLGAARASKP